MDSKHLITLLLIGGYFAAVLFSLVRRGREISGPWWFLLRSFLPNWRFYHDVGYQPRLFLRHRHSQQDWSSWSMFMPRARFHVLDLLHNPDNNLALARQNLVDHLSADVHALPDGDDARALVSYQLVNRLAREQLGLHGVSPEEYQFELRLVDPLGDAAKATMVMQSPVQRWT